MNQPIAIDHDAPPTGVVRDNVLVAASVNGVPAQTYLKIRALEDRAQGHDARLAALWEILEAQQARITELEARIVAPVPSPRKADELANRRQAIVELLQQVGFGLPALVISQQTGSNIGNTRTDLTALVEAGRIKRTKVDGESAMYGPRTDPIATQSALFKI